MNNSIFKTILIGILLGILAFFATKLVIVLLIIAAIFKLSGKGRWKREQWRSHKLAYVDNIRNMNEEDYENFKSDFRKNPCHNH